MKLRFRQDLRDNLINRFRNDEPRKGIHVSDLTSPCLKQSYFIKKGLCRPRDENILTWMIGIACHELLEGEIHDVPLELDGIHASIDFVKRDEALPVEIKSTRQSVEKDFVKNQWWLEQIMCYVKIFGGNRALLYIVYLMGDWKETMAGYKPWELEFTDKEIDDNWAEMLRRRDILLRSLEIDTPPVGPRLAWACKNCYVEKEICKNRI